MCAEEITDYLLPHSNWGDPVLPAAPNCPEVDFINNYFNHSSDQWICLDSKASMPFVICNYTHKFTTYFYVVNFILKYIFLYFT